MSQEIAWKGAHALVGPAPVEGRSNDVARATARASVHDITVETADAERLAALDAEWRDLTRRADAVNVFMHPALLRAAMTAYPQRRVLTLLAWRGTPACLVGLWAFATGRAPQSILPIRVLCSPPTPNAYLSTPVVDRDCLEAVCTAFLDRVATDPTLSKVVALDAIAADTATFAALERALAARRAPVHVFGRWQRPMLRSALDGKAYFETAMSASSRKKLRQHRRRLGEKGLLDSVMVTDADAVSAAFEAFLSLEASGWKGRQGTALASDAADAGFARAMIAALAARGEASIHSLTLDGRPVSMQVLLRTGRTAFTWKTAYDETLHDYSPGTLLFEDYTTRLLADETVDGVDSCAFDDSGYMATWQERAALAQLWLDVRGGGAVAFTVLCQAQRAYLAGRARAKAFYLQYLRRRGR